MPNQMKNKPMVMVTPPSRGGEMITAAQYRKDTFENMRQSFHAEGITFSQKHWDTIIHVAQKIGNKAISSQR